MKPRIREKGFTLVELLVVVSIISLLSSIIVPSIQEAREKARRSAYSQSLEQFRLALEVYRSEKGIYPYEDQTVLDEQLLGGIYMYENGVIVDALTDSLTTLGLIPKYISKVPLPIKLPGVTDLNFYYFGGPDFGVHPGLPFYCNYEVPKGYQLVSQVSGVFDDDEMISFGFKHSTMEGSPGAEVWPGIYCLTGTE